MNESKRGLARYREGDPLKSRDDAQHSAESFLRLYLQRARHSHRCRRTLSVLRLASQSDDRRRRYESEFGLDNRECATTALSKALTGNPASDETG
jgi:hypothetical protein